MLLCCEKYTIFTSLLKPPPPATTSLLCLKLVEFSGEMLEVLDEECNIPGLLVLFFFNGVQLDLLLNSFEKVPF